MSARGPRGAAVLTHRGEIASAPELTEVAGVGGPAERIALYRVLMKRLGRIEAVVIAGGKTGRGDGGPPTAATLQILYEFFPRARVYWGTSARPKGGAEVRTLLPEAFTRAHLQLKRKRT